MKNLLTVLFLVTANLLIAQTWNQISVPTSNKLNDIDFPSTTVGYIVGDSATILKSVDGGMNWSQLPLTGITLNAWSTNIVDVDFVDELIGYVVFENVFDALFKTIDGGQTWVGLNNGAGSMCYKNSIYVKSENDFFLGGAGCFQSAMIDNYVNPAWNLTTVNYESFNPTEYVTEMDFSGNVGIAATNGKNFLRSVDAGLTWDPIASNLQGDRVLTSVMFASPDTVYAGYQEPILYGFGFLISTDAGLTWTNQSTIGFFYPAAHGFKKANNGDLYAGGITVGDYGIVFESVDGTTWTETQVDYPLNSMDGYGSDVTFAVGDNGYVIVNADLASLGLSNDNSFSSVNVFPNPTSDFITIENAFNEPILYSLIGVNGQTVLATFEATNQKVIDLSMLPSGIYYLTPMDKQHHKVHKIVKL